MRSFFLPGRSTVHGVNGVCATSHPLASLAAIDILREGGNAVDAAIAASAVLCVVEPMSTGIGGDCFVLYAPRGGPDIIGLNGSGRAPMTLSADQLRAQGIAAIDPLSVHGVTVPGAVDAWHRLMEQHGRLGLERVLQPAIGHAEQGFVVTPVVAGYWDYLVPVIETTQAGRAHWLLHDRAPRAGELFRAPGLAKALRAIAKDGRSAFYEGELAEECVTCLQAAGGHHSHADFAATEASDVVPLTSDYRGHGVVELPPNGQGLTALLLLNILETFDLEELAPFGPERIHLQIEAQRLAYHLRDQFIADPDVSDVPVERLIDKETARHLARQIKPDIAMVHVPDGAPFGSDTVYLTVVDRDLNAVSFINSLYMGFGSGLVTPNTGIVFQNRGACFVLDEGHPNRLEGGKRPFHTIIPGLVCHTQGPYENKVSMSFGVMGGDYQPMGHSHVLSNMIDFGMDAQEALDGPRVLHTGGRIGYEPGLPAQTVEQLRAWGHQLEPVTAPWGGGQTVQIDWRQGTLIGASDPRKDGCALAY